jgi:hypothetical protein
MQHNLERNRKTLPQDSFISQQVYFTRLSGGEQPSHRELLSAKTPGTSEHKVQLPLLASLLYQG